MGFLGTVISILLGFYLLGFIGRLFLRFWIAKKVKDMQNGKGGAYYGGFWTNASSKQNDPNPKKEGDVTITSPGDSDRKIDSSVGEYVEYDEIKKDEN